jgi:intracellular multiplication protein IcmP
MLPSKCSKRKLKDMPPQAAPQGQSGADSHMGALWIIAALFVFAFLIWMFGHTAIIRAFFILKRIEIAIIQFFTVGLDSVKNFVLFQHPDDVTFQQATEVANKVGLYLRTPLAIFLGLLSLLLFFKSSAVKFCQTYNMGSLLGAEVTNFPHEIPILKIDLVKEDIEIGPWAMAITPMAFAKKHDLIDAEKPQGDLLLSISNKYKVTLRREKAQALFAEQLGSPWQGVQKLPPYMKALFAAFAAKASRDSDSSRDFLCGISHSSQEKLDFSGTDGLLKKYADTTQVRAVIEKHAYVLTVFASLIKSARLDGVLPSSEFLWLKPLDRRLWFMLNAVGRQTATIEVAGPFAHWVAELAMGEKIKSPMIEKAVDALDIALQEMIYKPDEVKSMEK